ncbi:RING/U-box superfamily protein [Striga hermonthica]|uniref:RING/U-box superfamily protein n=1 Tax=Striga hermonthica TaxID=68872 RepID=A0A9N7RGB6_STRHE|nr:RING/U-box superfamily protein [Striga hermonthica]
MVFQNPKFLKVIANLMMQVLPAASLATLPQPTPVVDLLKTPASYKKTGGGGGDDEISVVYATTFRPKQGATKSDAISVEDYCPKHKIHHADGDDLKILYFFPKSRKRVFTGECSRSKMGNNDAAHQFLCEICADEKPNRKKFSILGCQGTLVPQHCRSILPDRVFNRLGDALCEALILASEKFYCPFKDCSALWWTTRVGGMGKLKADERGSEDIMLVNLAKNMRWMRCPKCRFYVEKSKGCLFMQCRCEHGFCYNCGAPLIERYCRQCKH